MPYSVLQNTKNQWMQHHIQEAEYPTAESQIGLAHYLNVKRSIHALTLPISKPKNIVNLSLYWVDCHPLMIRYAQILSQAWAEKSTQANIIEYLTQFIFDENDHARCAVGFYHGKPIVCGMIFKQENTHLISDVFIAPHLEQDAIYQTFLQQLTQTIPSDELVYFEETLGNFQ
jgi:hypothetical protein